MYHMTPIHMAAEEGCADSMRAMMYHTRNRRSSVEYLAQRHGHFDIAEMLEQRWDEEAHGVAEEGQMQPPPIPTPGSPGVPMAYAHPVHTDDGSSQATPDAARHAGGRVAPSRGRTRHRGGGGLLSCCGGKPKRRGSTGVGVPAVRACAIHPPPSPPILTVVASECGLSSAGAQRRRCAQEGASSYAGVQYNTAAAAAGAGPAPPAEEAVAEPVLPPGCDPCLRRGWWLVLFSPARLCPQVERGLLAE